MSFLLARASSRTAMALRPMRRATAVRRMSGDVSPEEAQGMADTWMFYSAIFFCLPAAWSIYAISDHLGHHHDHEAPHYSYMQLRSKPFPWKCSNCNFIDPECYRKCKEDSD